MLLGHIVQAIYVTLPRACLTQSNYRGWAQKPQSPEVEDFHLNFWSFALHKSMNTVVLPYIALIGVYDREGVTSA